MTTRNLPIIMLIDKILICSYKPQTKKSQSKRRPRIFNEKLNVKKKKGLEV